MRAIEITCPGGPDVLPETTRPDPVPGPGAGGSQPHALGEGAAWRPRAQATATILLEEGVPMRVVSELLGHSSTRITEDVYSHVNARLAEESAKALDRAL